MQIQKLLIFLCCLVLRVIEANAASQQLPVDHILGKNREEIIASIHQFPKNEYQQITVPKYGCFYLDNLDDAIKNILRRGLIWEEHLVKLIRRYARPGSVILDIGAHIGTHTLAASRAVGLSGKVLAFEPQPKIFRELFWNMWINQVKNVEFYWSGVGDRSGVIELSPFAKGNEAGTGLNGGTGKFVELLTIDQLHLSNVSLMKIDVEGMEDQVLDGAKETILTHRPIILIEIMGGHIFQTAPPEIRQKILATIEKLKGLGYDVSQIQAHDWIAVPKKMSTN